MSTIGEVYVQYVQKFCNKTQSRAPSTHSMHGDCRSPRTCTDFTDVSLDFQLLEIIELENYTWLDSTESCPTIYELNEPVQKFDRDLSGLDDLPNLLKYESSNENVQVDGALHEFFLEELENRRQKPTSAPYYDPLSRLEAVESKSEYPNPTSAEVKSVKKSLGLDESYVANTNPESRYVDVAICLEVVNAYSESNPRFLVCRHDGHDGDFENVKVKIFCLDLNDNYKSVDGQSPSAVTQVTGNPSEHLHSEVGLNQLKYVNNYEPDINRFSHQENIVLDRSLEVQNDSSSDDSDSSDSPWKPRRPRFSRLLYVPAGNAIGRVSGEGGDILIGTSLIEPSDLDPRGYVRFYLGEGQNHHSFKDGDVIVRMGQFDEDPVTGKFSWSPLVNIDVFIHRTDDDPGIWFLTARVQNRPLKEPSYSFDPEFYIPGSVVLDHAGEDMKELDGDFIIRIGPNNFWNIVPWVPGFNRLSHDILLRASFSSIRDSTLGIAEVFWANTWTSYVFQGRRTELFHGSLTRSTITQVVQNLGPISSGTM